MQRVDMAGVEHTLPTGAWTVEQDLSVAQDRGMTLSQAVQYVRRQYDVQRVLNAETKRDGKREVHHIKILTRDNKVKVVEVPGRTLSSRG